MKWLVKLFDDTKLPVRVCYFAFVLIAIGFLIQNPNVNIFYTFKSSAVLFAGEFFLRIGELIVINLPLIFMLNSVCKKANSASPVIMALIGYFTFLVTTMLFGNQSLDSTAYVSSASNIINLGTITRLPFETGMIGSFCVAMITKFSFVLTRHRNTTAFTNLLAKETAGLVMNVFFCFLLGIGVSYVFPFVFALVRKAITFISTDLLDPVRIGIYSVMDRFMTLLGLSNMIKNPFWYTSLGGSLQASMTGQSILGDINIFNYISEIDTGFIGAGRFVTFYYVINLFMIPGIYLAMLFNMSDNVERKKTIFVIVCGILLSVIAGNPLPFEFLLLFSSPFLYSMYLLIVGIVSGCLVSYGAYLGFNTTVIANTAVAMPGSFPDYIINIRNSNLSYTLLVILIIGLIAFMACFLFTRFYYRYLAFDFIKTGKADDLLNNIVESAGGIENINDAGSTLFRLNLYLNNPDIIDIDLLREIIPNRAKETKNGLSFEFGSMSYAISILVKKRIQEEKNKVVNS